MGRRKSNSILSKIRGVFFRLTGPRTRYTYWSNSDFADWIRKISGVQIKPAADTLEGWHNWRKANENSWGYWIAEEFLDLLQDVVSLPADMWYAFRYYIKNRYFDKLHYLQTQLKPGQYYDVDTRLLHGMFETLVDFIEVEKAHMYWITYRPKATELRNWFMYGTKPDFIPKPMSHRFRFIRFYSDRSAPAGMKYLQWETTLDDPEANKDYSEWQPPEQSMLTQARVAQELINLYNWWKIERPSRPDPMDESGWTAYCDLKAELEEPMWEKTKEEREQTRKMLDQMREMEEQYDQEDEQMMIRLIKIRKHLWT